MKPFTLLNLEQVRENKCTGERYEGECLSLSHFNDWHGKFGHFNTKVLDHDSVVTAKGKHDRVCAHVPRSTVETFRIDHVWGLGMPTEKEILAVARKDQGLRGKWEMIELETEVDGSRSWATFKKL